jgi:uncharacterized membrane protein
MTFIKQFVVTALLFVAIDSVWLGFVANSFYQSQIGDLLRPEPNLLAAAVFYCIYLVALVVFVVRPGITQSVKVLSARAALFGLAMYATFDLTNLSVLEGWNVTITVVDLLWGMVISTAVANIACLILRHRKQ